MEHKVEDHLGLVRKIAGRYSERTRAEFDDLFQEGCIGLIKACREYKEGAVPFSAYAGQQITFAILNALRADNQMYVSATTVYAATKIKKLGLENEPAATIAEKLGLRVTAVQYALDHLTNELISLNKKIGKQDIPLMNLIPTTTDYTTGLLAYHIECAEGLSERDRKIIRLLVKGFDRKEITRLTNSKNNRALDTAIQKLRRKLQPVKEEILYG